MGHISYKFLSRVVQCFHAFQQLVKSIHDMYRLHIIRHRDGLITESFPHRIDRLGNSVERHRQHSGQQNCQRQDCHDHDHFHDICLAVQHFPGIYNTVIRNTGQHDTSDRIGIFFAVLVRGIGCGIHDGSSHLYVTVLRVVVRDIFPLKALNDFLGNDRLPLTDAVGIFFHLKVFVNDHHTAFVQIGQHLQLRIDDLSGIAGILSDAVAAQIIVADQVVRQDHQLVLHHRDPLFHRHILIIAHDTVPHDNTGDQSDHQNQQENSCPQTSQFDHALQIFPYRRESFFIPFLHNIKTSCSFTQLMDRMLCLQAVTHSVHG